MTIFVGVSLARIFQIGLSPYILLPTIIGCYPFFHATLEEYYVGSLDLPIINGPNEGCLIVVALYILSACTGTEIYGNVIFQDIKLGQFMSILLALA